MKFSEISEKVKYPPQYKASIQTIVSDIISYVSTHIPERLQGKKSIIDTINTVAYMIMSGDSIPDEWSAEKMSEGLPEIDSDELIEVLGDCYIYITDVVWDITADEFSNVSAPMKVINIPKINQQEIKSISASKKSTAKEQEVRESRIEDILLMPKTPQFDINNVAKSKVIDELQYTLYNSVPRIPTKQCEISMTTNVDEMTEKELLALFPNKVLYPRSAELYSDIPGIEKDEILGNLILINGYSKKQMLDNIIKYPYIHHLKRLGKTANGTVQVDFWKYIEIDGDIQRTLDVWEENKKFSELPKNKAIIEDVVVRNYLLKQDSRSKQKYQFGIFGDLQPYLMLFMPAEKYADFGYDDPVELARQCVISRVAYIKSRNPILRKLSQDMEDSEDV